MPYLLVGAGSFVGGNARFIIGRDSNVDPCRGRNVRPAS